MRSITRLPISTPLNTALLNIANSQYRRKIYTKKKKNNNLNKIDNL